MVVAPARCAMKSSSAGSIIKSFPEMAYHDGSVCHATGPDGVGAMEKLSGICSAFRVASRFGLRSWQKNCAKKAESMKAGDANGVPVQMKWLNASDVWKRAPRLKIESPWSGTNAAVKTRPSTSDRRYAAFEITIPPYECPTRIFGPEMPSSTARTIATSPAIDNRPSVGVTVVNPSFWSPATTMSQPGAEAQAPWTRTIVGRVSELSAPAIAGRTETISTAAMTIRSGRSRGLLESLTVLWACRANEAFMERPSAGPIGARRESCNRGRVLARDCDLRAHRPGEGDGERPAVRRPRGRRWNPSCVLVHRRNPGGHRFTVPPGGSIRAGTGPCDAYHAEPNRHDRLCRRRVPGKRGRFRGLRELPPTAGVYAVHKSTAVRGVHARECRLGRARGIRGILDRRTTA